MSAATDPSRRDFLRSAGAGGFALGGLLGLGLDVRAAREEAGRFKFANTREVPSVCPYCAVGCGQLVAVREGRIVNIEGNPDSPVNRGTLCPKGAATYQLAVNPNRVTQVWYRAPGAADWDTTKTLDWAMDRIADLVKQTRDASFEEFDAAGNLVNRTLAIGHFGGATLDNEENYLIKKLFTAGLGIVAVENQARI